jgi:hypothetical protein
VEDFMTDQSTHEQWTRPTQTLERAGPERTEPESSTQDSPAQDLAAAERSAEDGAVYHSAAHDGAVSDRTFAEPAVQSSAEHAVGVAPMPDARPGLDPQSAQQHAGVAVAAGPGGSVDDIDEVSDATGGQTPTVPASADDAAAPDVAGSGELLPGDVPTEPVALFDGAATKGFRDRWQQLQLRFIDDPHAVAAQAGAMADEVITALRDAVDQHRRALEDWQSDDGVDAHFGDTERLRVAVRRYRDFVDRLLAM